MGAGQPAFLESKVMADNSPWDHIKEDGRLNMYHTEGGLIGYAVNLGRRDWEACDSNGMQLGTGTKKAMVALVKDRWEKKVSAGGGGRIAEAVRKFD